MKADMTNSTRRAAIGTGAAGGIGPAIAAHLEKNCADYLSGAVARQATAVELGIDLFTW
jgi:NADP-dependent 3-hydroxy acid dehydrogenase YdfG